MQHNSILTAMNELLFECYHVPQVTYGIDSLYSLYYNQHSGNSCQNAYF